MPKQDTEQMGLVLHIYGSQSQRYGVLKLLPENALVYFKVEKIFIGEEEMEGSNIVLSSVLQVNTPVVLTDCNNILRINPTKNYASVDLLFISDVTCRCVDLDYSVFMGGLASSQIGDEFDAYRAVCLPTLEPPPLNRLTPSPSPQFPSESDYIYSVNNVATPPLPTPAASQYVIPYIATTQYDSDITPSEDSGRRSSLSKEMLNFDSGPPKAAYTKLHAASKSREFVNSSFAQAPPIVRKANGAFPVSNVPQAPVRHPPPVLVEPPLGYTYLDASIAYVHPSNTSPHVVSFQYNNQTLLGSFYIRYVSINGSRIRAEECEKVRGLLRVGMPACVIHFKIGGKGDPRVPYLTVVNLREEVLHSKEWQSKPAFGPLQDGTSCSIWDMVDVNARPPKEFPSEVRARSATPTPRAKEAGSEIPDGFSCNGIVESFADASCTGVATIKYQKQRHAVGFTLTEVVHGSDRVDSEKYGEYVKAGSKVWLTVRKAAAGAEHNYEADGLMTVAKTATANIAERIFDGVVRETIENEGKVQPRIVTIWIDNKKEGVFIAAKNVKVDGTRSGRTSLPDGFCQVGMKVKVSNLKEYNKTYKYEGVVNFQSSDLKSFVAGATEFEANQVEDAVLAKLHFTGWDKESTGTIVQVVTRNGKTLPNVVNKTVDGKATNVLIDRVTITGRPFEETDHDFTFDVGVIVKLGDVKQVAGKYHGVVELTEEEANLYDCVKTLDAAKQNEIIGWSVRGESETDKPRPYPMPAATTDVPSSKENSLPKATLDKNKPTKKSKTVEKLPKDKAKEEPKVRLKDKPKEERKAMAKDKPNEEPKIKAKNKPNEDRKVRVEDNPREDLKAIAIQQPKEVVQPQSNNEGRSIIDGMLHDLGFRPVTSLRDLSHAMSVPDAKFIGIRVDTGAPMVEEDVDWENEELMTLPEDSADKILYEGTRILMFLHQSDDFPTAEKYYLRSDIMQKILGIFEVITTEHIYFLCRRFVAEPDESVLGDEVRRCLLLIMVCAIAGVIEGHTALSLHAWNPGHEKALEEVQRALGLRMAKILGTEISKEGKERDRVFSRKYREVLQELMREIEHTSQRTLNVVKGMKKDFESQKGMKLEERKIDLRRRTEEILTEAVEKKKKMEMLEARQRGPNTVKTMASVKKKTEDIEKRKKVLAIRAAKQNREDSDSDSEQTPLERRVKNAVWVAKKYGIKEEVVKELFDKFQALVQVEREWLTSATAVDNNEATVREFLVCTMVVTLGTMLDEKELPTEHKDALGMVKDALLLQAIDTYDEGRYKKTDFSVSLEKYLNKKYNDMLEVVKAYIIQYSLMAYESGKDLDRTAIELGRQRVSREGERKMEIVIRKAEQNMIERVEADQAKIVDRIKRECALIELAKKANEKFAAEERLKEKELEEEKEKKQRALEVIRRAAEEVEKEKKKIALEVQRKKEKALEEEHEKKRRAMELIKRRAEELEKQKKEKALEEERQKKEKALEEERQKKEKALELAKKKADELEKQNKEKALEEERLKKEKALEAERQRIEKALEEEKEKKRKALELAKKKSDEVEKQKKEKALEEEQMKKKKALKEEQQKKDDKGNKRALSVESEKAYDIFLQKALLAYHTDTHAHEVERQKAEEARKRKAYADFTERCLRNFVLLESGVEPSNIPSMNKPHLTLQDLIEPDSTLAVACEACAAAKPAASVKVETCEQASQTIITGNIMFFNYDTNL